MDLLAALIENDRRFFAKYQRSLLRIANSFFGRWYFRVKEHPSDRIFTRIHPNALEWEVPEGKVIEIRTSNRYANRIKHTFRFLHFLSSVRVFVAQPIASNGFLLSPYVMMATYTFNPESGSPGVSSMDGAAVRTSGGLGAGESWATLRGGAGTSLAGAASSDVAVRWVADNVSNQWRIMARGIFSFDTSVLGSGSVISSATLSLYVSSLTTPTDATASKRQLRVVSGTASASLTSADFTNTGGTSFGALTFASVTTSAYNDVTLDANGRANISLTGISGFACRSGADLDNSAPTWSSFDELAYVVAMADTGGTSSDPKLTVVLSTVVKTLSESAAHTDARSNVTSRTLSEGVSHSENITLFVVMTIILSEASSYTEGFVRIIGKVLAEAAAHTDTKMHQIAKLFTDASVFTDVYSKVVSRVLGETGAFLDTISVRNVWTKRTKPTTTWTDRTKPPTTWS